MTSQAKIDALHALYNLRVRLGQQRVKKAVAVEASRTKLAQSALTQEAAAKVMLRDYTKTRFAIMDFQRDGAAASLSSLFAGYHAAQRVAIEMATLTERRVDHLKVATKNREDAAKDQIKSERTRDSYADMADEMRKALLNAQADAEDDEVQELLTSGLNNEPI